MKITRDNYESWFLDYLEGRLEEGSMEEFIRFLHENQDLKEELSGFETVTLDPPEVVFHGKENLHRDIYDLPEAFDQAAVARMEGDAEPAEALRFEDFLQKHPEKQKEADLFWHTRLIPDPSIVFPGKETLYHRPVIRQMMTWTMRVAAVLLVAALTYAAFDMFQGVPGPGTEFAGTAPETPGTTAVPGNADGSGNAADQGMPASPEVPAHSGAVDASGSPLDGMPGNSTRKSPEKRFLADNRPRSATAGTIIASSATGIIPEREEVPEYMELKEAAVDLASAPLALVYATGPTAQEPLWAGSEPDIRTLNELIMEKTGLDELGKRIDNLSISKLTRFGLRVAAELTNKKFSYNTDGNGDIIAYNLDTKLIGLSIPVRNKD